MDVSDTLSARQLIVWDLGRPGKARMLRILDHLRQQRYDVLVLAKCPARLMPILVEGLEAAGYQVLLGGGSFQPSLVVASLIQAKPTNWPGPEGYEHRWTALDLAGGIHALGVHIPYAGEAEGLEGKRRYWEAVLAWSMEHVDSSAMILGVFNTGLPADTQGERFALGSYIQELLDRGWVDCWRHANPGLTDFGWSSHAGNGFRLDHCFLSPSMASALVRAEFDHETRADGLASSAPLVVAITGILQKQ